VATHSSRQAAHGQAIRTAKRTSKPKRPAQQTSAQPAQLKEAAMPNYQTYTAFQSNFLAATDLSGPTIVVVVDVTEEEIGKEKDLKMVAKLRDHKPWIVNKTNARSLAKMYGDDTNNWVNKPVTLITPDVEFNGQSKPAIRVLVKPGTRKLARPPIEVDLKDKIPDFDGPPDPPPADLDGSPL
jgi:hypothetical protein